MAISLFISCSLLHAQSEPESEVNGMKWTAGGDATFYRTFLSNPTGLTVRDGDGISREDFQTLDFESSFSSGYRLFLGVETPYGVGLRGSYWGFDPKFNELSTRPPANGFGEVTHPEFGEVDIGSTVPADRITASTFVDMAVANGELTHRQPFEVWKIATGVGVEHARLEQGYRATLVNDNSGNVGSIDFQRKFGGTGPSVQLEATLDALPRVELFGSLRSSLLFGTTKTNFIGGEDLDLTPSLITTDRRERRDFLTRFEGRIGSRIYWHRTSRLSLSSTIAMEGQNWIGAGSASSESGSLGLFGLALGSELRF